MRALWITAALGATACERIDFERMIDQPSYRSYETSDRFADGMAMRRPPDGTIPRSRPLGPRELVDGMSEGGHVGAIPLEVDRAMLERGRDRFRIFCAACHGARGDGVSQVAENMTLRKPRSLHDPAVVAYPPGRIYGVIVRGYGLMPAYQDKLAVEDRWAVVAYVQALQLSQSAKLSELPGPLREEAEQWLR
jgi:mono/diheme cytochrome c family protein